MDNKRKKISVEALEGKLINIDFTQAESGQRLDMALAGLIDGMSSSRVKTLILEGNLTQNGKTIKKREIVICHTDTTCSAGRKHFRYTKVAVFCFVAVWRPPPACW